MSHIMSILSWNNKAMFWRGNSSFEYVSHEVQLNLVAYPVAVNFVISPEESSLWERTWTIEKDLKRKCSLRLSGLELQSLFLLWSPRSCWMEYLYRSCWEWMREEMQEVLSICLLFSRERNRFWEELKFQRKDWRRISLEETTNMFDSGDDITDEHHVRAFCFSPEKWSSSSSTDYCSLKMDYDRNDALGSLPLVPHGEYWTIDMVFTLEYHHDTLQSLPIDRKDEDSCSSSSPEA